MNTADSKYILDGHIAPLILDGIDSTNEFCRMEFVLCLADCITRFPTNSHFAHLQCINKAWKCDCAELDYENIEMDTTCEDEKDSSFFENAIHIQMHRRQRAYYRLSEQLTTGEVCY